MDLYNYSASSTSYRVRIALNLKSLDAHAIPVDLIALEQRKPDYMAKNPAACVPLLDDDGFRLGQSLAIIDYLDAKYPNPRLIPQDLHQRARVLEIANLIACDIQPLNGLRVLRYFTNQWRLDPGRQDAWYHDWIAEGFRALEALLGRARSGPFCLGADVSLADCCLVPQVANAKRAGCPLDAYARVMAVYEHCMTLPAFADAAPKSPSGSQARGP